MNDQELDDLLGALRADTPAMTDDAFAAGRARLTAAGTRAAETQNVPTTRDAERGPTRVVEPYQPAAPPGRRDRSVRRYAPWLVAAAVLGAVGVAVAVLPGDPSRVSPAGPSSSDAAQAPVPGTTAPSATGDKPVPGGQSQPTVLPEMPAQPVNSAGDLAANVSDFPVGPGQFFYVRTVRKQAASAHGSDGELLQELWVPYDQQGDWFQRRSAVTGQVQGGPDPDANGGVEELTAAGGELDGPTEYPWVATPAAIADLPTDPAELYALLDADGERGGHGVTEPTAVAAAKLVNLLAHPSGAILPADVRAAAYRTLGYLPGLIVTEGVLTHDGRSAVALGVDATAEGGGYRGEVLVDPATGQIVGSRYIAFGGYGGYPDGTAYGQSAVTLAVATASGVRP